MSLNKKTVYLLRPNLPVMVCPLLDSEIDGGDDDPRYDVLERICDIPRGYVERIGILFDGRPATMFGFEEARVPGAARPLKDVFNPVATCLYQNWVRKRSLGTEFPCEAIVLGEQPAMPYVGLSSQGLFIHGAVGLWLGA